MRHTLHKSPVYVTGDRRRPYAVNVTKYEQGNPMPVGMTVHRFAREADAKSFAQDPQPPERKP